MLDRVNNDITALEQNMNKAEQELGYNNTGFKGFFKPLIGKIVKNDRHRAENVDTELTYKPIETFKSAEYFGESSSNCLIDDDNDDATDADAVADVRES